MCASQDIHELLWNSQSGWRVQQQPLTQSALIEQMLVETRGSNTFVEKRQDPSASALGANLEGHQNKSHVRVWNSMADAANPRGARWNRVRAWEGTRVGGQDNLGHLFRSWLICSLLHEAVLAQSALHTYPALTHKRANFLPLTVCSVSTVWCGQPQCASSAAPPTHVSAQQLKWENLLDVLPFDAASWISGFALIRWSHWMFWWVWKGSPDPNNNHHNTKCVRCAA